MTNQQLIDEIYSAFREMMLVNGIFGIKVGKEGVKWIWDKYFLPKLEWRLKRLNEKV